MPPLLPSPQRHRFPFRPRTDRRCRRRVLSRPRPRTFTPALLLFLHASGWLPPSGKLAAQTLPPSSPAPPGISVPQGPYRGGPGRNLCPEGRIEEIVFENRSIFDLSRTEDSRFGWAFRLANKLHRRTSARFLERELLFRKGECWDPERGEETARFLRGYRFIANAEVEPEITSSGGRLIRVHTRDEWTTKLRAGLRWQDGSLRLRNLSLTEENFMGRGILLGAFLVEREDRRDYGLSFEMPQTLGTRVDTSLRFGATKLGDFLEQEIAYPFVAEEGRIAFRQRFRDREDYFHYHLRNVDGHWRVRLPVREEMFEVTGAIRLGERGNLTLFGLGFQRDELSFPLFPGGVDIVDRHGAEGSFDGAPSDEIVEALAMQARSRNPVRANFLFGQRNVRFVERRGLDALTGILDVPIGTEIEISIGRSLGPLQGSDSVDDLFTRGRLFLGFATGRWTANQILRVEGRRAYAGGESTEGWRDILAEFGLDLYLQPEGLPDHTFFLRASGTGGWNVDLPYQLSLGGPHAVRGFPEGAFPGGRRTVLSLEDRIRMNWPYPALFDSGITLFADAGYIERGEVPFGTDSGWRGAVGAGLRIGFPAGTRGVARIDLAFPVGGPERNPVLILSIGELLGLTAGFADPQMARSLRTGASPSFPGVAR